MGSGIALVALYAGCEVYLQDVSAQMLDKAAAYIRGFLEKKDQVDRLKKLHVANSLDAFVPVDVAIEAALEQIEIKSEIFRKLEAACSPTAILATNTSTLSVTSIAAATQRPERVAGLHFFNPAPVLPLVEVVRAARTSQETIDRLVGLTGALGKTPVVTGDTPGFIVNRVARPFYGEALRLLGEGVASHEQIDQIVEQGGGFKMGPFRLMDLIGIDINAGAMRSMYEQTFGEPRYRPHWIQMQKLAEGALGRKTGRGFYDYKGERIKEKGEGEKEKREKGKQSGKMLISEGSWAPGLAALCAQTGFEVASIAESGEAPAACFVVAGRREDAARLIEHYDQSIPEDVPLFVQCADITLSEAAGWVRRPERLIGFDGLFLEGSAVTLAQGGELTPEVRTPAEEIIRSLGKEPAWVNESPAMILPRIVCQLVNEAAFAELEGVAEGETIDLAMRLGVNYPRGPLEWGKAIGYDKVLGVLDYLYAQYHEERYRACVVLRREALSRKL